MRCPLASVAQRLDGGERASNGCGHRAAPSLHEVGASASCAPSKTQRSGDAVEREGAEPNLIEPSFGAGGADAARSEAARRKEFGRRHDGRRA